MGQLSDGSTAAQPLRAVGGSGIGEEGASNAAWVRASQNCGDHTRRSFAQISVQ